MKPTSAEVRRLDENLADFDGLLDLACRHLAGGRRDTAAAYAQAAAAHAWTNHTGLFASAELEMLLARLGEGLPPEGGRSRRSADPATVLHVATQMYPTGGHTQAIACWMDQDADRRHRICLTRQGSVPVPGKIAHRLVAPYELVRLDDLRGGLLRRAAALRELAGACDVVLLHLHPYDVVPTIAFSGVDGLPPIVVVDHSDHTFWVGASVADLHVAMRESGRHLATARRGIDPARSEILSRPLRLAGRTRERAEAKRALGLAPDDVVFVTAADATKYRPIESPGFLDLVVPFFADEPRAHLLAAGPSPDGPWLEAAARTGGRVRALGRLPDVLPLHEAADAYLDSYPFASLTSLLEAGNLGAATLSYRGHPAGCGVLGADTPGVDEHLLVPGTPAELTDALARLVADATWRIGVGERTRQVIAESHTGQGWAKAAARMYEAAASAGGRPTLHPSVRGTGQLDVRVREVMHRTGHGRGVSGAVQDNLGLLPLVPRVRAAATGRDGMAPRHLLPEWLVSRISQRRQRVRRPAGRAGVSA